MKTVLSGKIVDIEEIKGISTVWNKESKLITAKLGVEDEKGKENSDGNKPMAVYTLKAWDEKAEELSQYSIGDKLTCVVTPRVSIIPSEKSYTKKEVSLMNYVVSSIDKTNTLATQLHNLLSEYDQGKISQIYENFENDVYSSFENDYGKSSSLEVLNDNNLDAELGKES